MLRSQSKDSNYTLCKHQKECFACRACSDVSGPLKEPICKPNLSLDGSSEVQKIQEDHVVRKLKKKNKNCKILKGHDADESDLKT